MSRYQSSWIHWFVVPSLIVGAIAAMSGDAVQAQSFRRPIGPALARPAIQGPFAFNNFAASFNITLPSQTRATRGGFDPRTGAFVPGFNGSFVLSGRRPFEPVTGSFVPSSTGRFVLAARESFNPSTGTLTPSPFGNILLRTRGDFVPSSGSFTQAAQGNFNPATGAFAPGNGTPFTLQSRGVFVPTNGTFIPSPTGNFLLTAKQTFNPGTGTFTVSPDGTFQSQVRGTFVPNSGTLNSARVFVPTSIGLNLGNGAFVPANAFALATTLGLANPSILSARVQAANITGYGQAVNSAYINAIYGYNQGSFFNPYWYGAYNSNPTPYYSPYYPPYAYGSPSYSAPASTASTAPPPPPVRAPAAVAAFGIPTNDDGSIAWPFAFRLMAPDAKREMLEPLETQLRVAAKQANTGKANANVIREGQQGVERLQEWLRTHRLDLAEGSIRDANVFLGRIDAALRAMRPDA